MIREEEPMEEDKEKEGSEKKVLVVTEKAELKLQTTTDVPQQNDFNQEEVLDEQQLLAQERNFTVVQVGADCSQIKEEQEDVRISQEGEQFELKQETQTSDEESVSACQGSRSVNVWHDMFKCWQEEKEPPHNGPCHCGKQEENDPPQTGPCVTIYRDAG
ncbi:uncharacterized protein KZ484_015668 isoform 2-T2 [Pholidichthys leucotaenia]